MSWINAVDDRAFQAHALEQVSRTFALTIPELPPPLAHVVGNAYLLCRIADTIEDDASLPAAEKRAEAERFIRVLAGGEPAEAFAASLAPRLDAATPAPERQLIRDTPRVVAITQGFTDTQRAALERCVRVMSRGMADFQEGASREGLADQAAMDRYCYHVAGVVGEMLTELFCEYSPAIAARRERLVPLAVSFGQGLQMTNILKDVWEDHRRGACWLPRSVFAAEGVELARMAEDPADPRLVRGLHHLVGLACAHLHNALDYTLAIPPEERGIRRFLLWALGMAVLTLRRIHANVGYRSGQQVKISRNAVRATVLFSNAAVAQDAVLRAAFGLLTRRCRAPGGTPAAEAQAVAAPGQAGRSPHGEGGRRS